MPRTTLRRTRRNKGFALVIVLGFTAISLVALGGALTWTSATARTTDRNNQYFSTLAAAEAATEKVLAKMSGDFQVNGIGTVVSSLPIYRSAVPTPAEDPLWSSFQFSDAAGRDHATQVEQVSNWAYTNLNSQYTGLKAYASTFRVLSNARSTFPPAVVAAVQQDVQLASVPVFQFAIFYTMDLEIHPGAVMNINGRVHSNGEIYTQPNISVSYLDHVTAVRNINLFQSPLDPTARPTDGVVNFLSEHDARVSSLTLPIGTNNSPEAVHSVLKIPPWNESPHSLMGKQRYYNKADLIVVYDDSGVLVRKRNGDSISSATYNTFLTTNAANHFYNLRENKKVKTIQFNVAAFNAFSAGAYKTVYIADTRKLPSDSQWGIRIVNGETLQSGGLTIATPNPLYVKGHFNSPSATRGTSNTSGTRPASLVADSITILSKQWDDSESQRALKYRVADHTTVNAAFLAGIVPSDGTHYSGGVENFPRFLENWSGKTFTYNGSMVVMFYSFHSDSPWPGTGTVYNPANRNWSFDINFMDVTKLPPGTPQLLTMVRGAWTLPAPESI